MPRVSSPRVSTSTWASGRRRPSTAVTQAPACANSVRDRDRYKNGVSVTRTRRSVGVQAEFSLPLTGGLGGIGTLDLCRDRPGMLSDEHLADALVTADIARDAVLYQPYAPGGPGVAELLAAVGTDRIVIHQATGMIAAQLNDTTSNALARLRAAAFASGRPMYDIAQDVVERRMRFDD